MSIVESNCTHSELIALAPFAAVVLRWNMNTSCIPPFPGGRYVKGHWSMLFCIIHWPHCLCCHVVSKSACGHITCFLGRLCPVLAASGGIGGHFLQLFVSTILLCNIGAFSGNVSQFVASVADYVIIPILIALATWPSLPTLPPVPLQGAKVIPSPTWVVSWFLFGRKVIE